MIKFNGVVYTKEDIQKIVKESTSISEVLRKVHVSDRGGNHQRLKKYLSENNIDNTTLVGRKICRVNRLGIPKKRLSQVLVKHSTGNSNSLRNRLLANGIKTWVCEKCGNSVYDGEPIPLELHHVNGDHFDNRLENLLLLCPICHSKTSNFRGKNNQYDKVLSDIAKKNSEGKLEKLLEKESLEKQIYTLKKIERGEITLTKQNKTKIKQYCECCGKEITKRGRKKYCSTECAKKMLKRNEYNKEKLIGDSKTVHSMIEFGNLYKISDNAIKKHLKQLGILDICKSNFISSRNEILQYTLSGDFVKEWKNSSEIEKELGIKKQNVNSCANGERKSSNGYIWRYKA